MQRSSIPGPRKKRSSTGLAPVRISGVSRPGTTAGAGPSSGAGRGGAQRGLPGPGRGRPSTDFRPPIGSTPARNPVSNLLYHNTPSGAHSSSISFASSGAKKDIRPLQDKNYQRKLAGKIAECLNATYFDEELSAKDVLKISSQTFVRYFTHFYNKLEPGYVLPSRQFDEEVLRICKELNYGGTVQRSSLITIGSPHSLGPVLGLIGWLGEMVSAVELLNPERDPAEMDEYELGTRAYCLFVDGGNLKELSGDCYRFQLRKMGVESEEAVSKLEEATAALRKELAACSKPSQIIKTKEKFETMRDEHDRLEKAIEAHQSTVGELEKAIWDQENTLKDLNAQIEAHKQKVAKLKEIVATQPISASDAQAINQACRGLTDKIAEKEKTLNMLREHIWNTQKEISQLNVSLSQARLQVQETAMKLGIPLDTESPETLVEQVEKKLSDIFGELKINEELSWQESEKISKVERRLEQIQLEIKSVNFEQQQRNNRLDALKVEEKQFDKEHEAALKKLEDKIDSLTKTLPGSGNLAGLRKELQELEEMVSKLENRCQESEAANEHLAKSFEWLYNKQMENFNNLLQRMDDFYTADNKKLENAMKE